MRISSKVGLQRRPALDAFTLIEALIGMAIVGTIFVALYTAMTGGFRILRLARENVGANQVMAEKFETMRLYNWDPIDPNGFIPATFVVPIDPTLTNSSQNYTGTVTIASSGVSELYSNDLQTVRAV